MSQIPSRVQRPTPGRGPLERQQPVSPIVTPLIPVGNDGQTFAQALGLVKQAGELAGEMARENERVEKFDAAQATRDGRATLATLSSRVAELADTWDPATTSAETFAKQLAGEHIPTNASPAYLRSFDSTFVPPMIGLLEAHRAGLATRDEAEMIRLRGEAFIGVTEPAHAGQLWEELRSEPIFHRRTDDELMMLSVLPAAESAAKAGLREEFEAIRSVIGDRFPGPMRLHDAALRAAEARNRAEAQEAAQQDYAGLRRQGTPTDALRQFAAQDPRLDDRSRLAIEQGLDAMDSADLREAQHESGNALARDIFLRRWIDDNPLATANELIRRMDLPPADVDFLNADRGRQLLHEFQSVLSFDARLARVQQAFSRPPAQEGQQPAVRPILTAADDSALLRYLADAGVVEGVQDGQAAVLNRIDKPLSFAAHIAAAGRLPKQAADHIAAGLASGDGDQQLEAAAAFAALHIQRPDLAAAIEMTPAATMRARYLASRQAQFGRADSDTGLRSNLSLLMQEASRLQPLDITDNQVAGLVFWRDANAKSATDTREVHNRARKALGESMKDSRFWSEVGWWSRRAPGWTGGVTIADAPADVINTFRAKLTEEYRFARSIYPDEQTAASSARRFALERTLAEHPPLLWNGRVYWTNNRDLPATPDLQDHIIRDLMTTPPDAGEQFEEIRRELVRDLVQNHVPVWDAGQNGFVFYSVDDPFVTKTIWTGSQVGPLVLDPFSAPTQSDAQQAINALNAHDRNREQQDRERRPLWLDIIGSMGGPMLP